MKNENEVNANKQENVEINENLENVSGGKSGGKEKFDRSKKHENIGNIRNYDHSKTTLKSAITTTLNNENQNNH